MPPIIILADTYPHSLLRTMYYLAKHSTICVVCLKKNSGGASFNPCWFFVVVEDNVYPCCSEECEALLRLNPQQIYESNNTPASS